MRANVMNRPDVLKGRFYNNKIVMFDAVKDCIEDECPIFKVCKYQKFGKCGVETKYIRTIFGHFLETIGPDMTQLLLNRISLQIMPLFHQLIKVKIEAASSDKLLQTINGRYVVNPLLREERDIIKTISMVMKDIGFGKEYQKALGFEESKGESYFDVGHGDAAYVETLSTDGMAANTSRKRRLRRKKTVDE